jgi:hypothetical protein
MTTDSMMARGWDELAAEPVTRAEANDPDCW